MQLAPLTVKLSRLQTIADCAKLPSVIGLWNLGQSITELRMSVSEETSSLVLCFDRFLVGDLAYAP